jgi:putative transposase
LRTAFRQTQNSHPFTIDAVVILPDHLHVIMTLPDGDADFSNRWRLIKRRFTTALTAAGVPIARRRNGE